MEEGKRLTKDTENQNETQMSRGKKLWKDYGYLLVTMVTVLLLCKVIGQLAYVPSGSMETTLPTKSLTIGWRLPYFAADPTPKRGDVVTFYSDELGKVLVKRVIGLPGDEITFVDGFVWINGVQLDESYLPRQGETFCDGSFTVPEGCFFAMGDNRTGSHDCRFFEDHYIPVEKIQAKIFLAVSVGSNHSWQGVRFITK